MESGGAFAPLKSALDVALSCPGYFSWTPRNRLDIRGVTTPRMLRLLFLTAALLAFAATPALASSAASITVSPGTASVGDQVTVNGKGFKARKKCVLSVAGDKVAKVRTTKRGRLKASFEVPVSATEDLSVTVTCGGATASTTLAVLDGAPNADGDNSSGDSGDITFDDDDGSDPGFDISF
jgi:hypothetical protein